MENWYSKDITTIEDVEKEEAEFKASKQKEKEENQITIKSASEEIPLDCNNLVYKAADLIKKTFNLTKGVEIYIQKNIPVAAGLAGGSTDCAAGIFFSIYISTPEFIL